MHAARPSVGKMLALAALFLMFCGLARTARAADLVAASNKAHSWLKSQMTATGLVDSYKDAKDVCYTYDQAVATVAFLAKGDVSNARRVLDALQTLQNDDGSWNSAYACTTGGTEEAQRYVGATAWVALAIANYESITGDTVTYNIMGQRALNWVVLWQRSDGGINGGLDANGVPIAWASTEHNEDSYGALGHFAYANWQAGVKSFLDGAAWNTAGQRWNQGRNDTVDSLDVNPLGVGALGASGARNYRASLDYCMTHHRSTQFRLQSGKWIVMDGFDLNSDRNDIWLEGTAQMAVAFRAVGRTADSDYFINQIVRVQQRDGGVPYSLQGTFNGDFTMSTNPAVASTAWLVIAIAHANPMQPEAAILGSIPKTRRDTAQAAPSTFSNSSQ